MPLRDILPENIDEAVLRNLISAQVPEARTIDYKIELPGGSDSAKRDYLADLCSFANADGGHIVFGMSEVDGLPVELSGVESDIDVAILRLESMARDGIRPPVPGLMFQRAPLENGRTAIVAAVPRSWNRPHQVIFQRDYRFYTRGSAGKQHLEVGELRQIVLVSEEQGERIRQFRVNRISSIMQRQTPVDMILGAKQILHVMPMATFSMGSRVDLSGISKNPVPLINSMNSGGSVRHNIDGVVAFSQVGEACDSYAQLFRNGAIEVVMHLDEWKPRGRLVLPSEAYEGDLFQSLEWALRIMKIIAAQPPYVVMFSLTGVMGWEMGTHDSFGFRRHPGGFDRDPLLIPELVLESVAEESASTVARPIVEMVWNAAGFAESGHYDDDGKWVGERRR